MEKGPAGAPCALQADDQGYLPLQWAALNNRVACCHHLLENGAAVGATDGIQQTALHWAAVRGSLSAAELLLRAGASLDAADCRGYTVSAPEALRRTITWYLHP